jgi:hypothetical protein
MMQGGREARPQIRDPRGPGKRDLPLIEVDGARRVSLDLQDTRYVPIRQRFEGDGDGCCSQFVCRTQP